MRLDIVLDVSTQLGESPCETSSRSACTGSTASASAFRSTSDGRELRSRMAPEPIGSMALTSDGTAAVVALAKGVHVLDLATGRTSLVTAF
jgi:L-arabinonolactonase